MQARLGVGVHVFAYLDVIHTVTSPWAFVVVEESCRVHSPPPRPEEPEPTQPQQRASRKLEEKFLRECGLTSVTVPEHCCVPNMVLWLLRL